MTNQIKQLESGHFTFWKCYIQGASWTKQYHCFSREAPRSSRKIDFYACNLD